MKPHISLAAEQIGEVFGWPITNSVLMTWLVMVFLLLFTYFVTRNMKRIPGTLQSIAEVILDGIYTLFSSVVGADKIDQFFPLLASIFLFVVCANWSGLLPGVGSIGLKAQTHAFEWIRSTYATTSTTGEIKTENLGTNETHDEQRGITPLFRGPTADLNTTLALALIAVISLQYFGLKALGLGYLSKFFNFSNPINFFLGILELISEFAKIISFAFRLFGNIFAGEVLLTVIAFLMPLFAPLPFLGLELFVGVIQGLVFSMLTAVFLNMATVAHGDHEVAHEHA